MAAADARAALSRSRVVARALVQHAAQVVGLVVLLRALAEFPWAAAAAPSILRFAASFLAPPRLCFLVANAIVIFLARFFPRDAASLSPPFADLSGSPSSNGDAPKQHPFLAFLEDPQLQALPPITESEPSGTGEQAPPPPPPEEVPVFEDKQAVHVKTVRAQPPRRTMSEKTTRGGAAAAAAADRSSTTSAASPELRRAKSENSRRRQQRRSAAAAPAAVELGTDDAEAFRQAVEAFIAKQQTWFHREESMVIARAAAAGGAGGEDGPGKIAGAAAAAVVVK